MATREIKTTIALDGERQFKKALSDINSSLRVSASELKLVTAEFGKNDRGMKGLKDTAKVLADQLAMQKEKVRALSGAVKDSQTIYDKAKEKYKQVSEQFGEQSREAEKARNAMINAGKSVDHYTSELYKAAAETKKLESGLKETEKAAKDLKNLRLTDLMPKEVAEKVRKVADEFENVAKQAGKAAAKAAQIGAGTVKKSLEVSTKALTAYATAASSAATAVIGLTVSAAAWSDDLNTLSTKTHIATEDLQKMQYAAELVDVDVETVTGSIAKMVNKLDTKAGQEAFKKLGVSVTGANGELRKSEDIFYDAIEALGGIANETERDALAMDLFGKSAQDLNPLIDGGAEALKKYGEQAEELGLILSQDAVDTLNSLNDSLDIIKSNSAAVGRVLATQFAPKIQTLTDIVGRNIPKIANSFGQVFTGVEGASEKFREELKELTNSLSDEVQKMLPGLLSGFNTLVISIAENVPSTVVKLLPDFITGLKDLVSGIIDILPTQLPIIVDGAVSLFTGLLYGLNEVLDKLIPMLPGMIRDIGEALTKNAAPLLAGGVELLANIVEGIAVSVPELVKQAAELIPEIINGLMENLPLLIQAGIDLIIALAEALPIAIPALLDAVPQIIDALIGAFSEIDWEQTALDVFVGFESGFVALFSGALGIVDSLLGTNLKQWYDDITDFWFDAGSKLYEVLHADEINSIEMQNKYGSLDSYVTQSFNEYIRNGLDLKDAWDKALSDNLTSGEAMAYFNSNFASQFSDAWLSAQAETVLKNAANSYEAGASAAVSQGRNGMPSTVPAGSTSITFNNYSPTEKTVYQQTQQNKQQLDIARQYAP